MFVRLSVGRSETTRPRCSAPEQWPSCRLRSPTFRRRVLFVLYLSSPPEPVGPTRCLHGVPIMCALIAFSAWCSANQTSDSTAAQPHDREAPTSASEQYRGIVPGWRLSALDRHRPRITAIGWCLDVCHKKNTNASRRQEFFRRWTVSLERCLLHYVTETSRLYSLRDFWKHFGLSIGLRRIVTVAFLRRV